MSESFLELMSMVHVLTSPRCFKNEMCTVAKATAQTLGLMWPVHGALYECEQSCKQTALTTQSCGLM